VIRAVLAHPQLSKEYHLRAVTRDSTKPAAEALKAKGVDVVQGDLKDPASIAAAVAGSYAVFGVTNFWETMSKEAEVAQGRTIADASKAAGVKHMVWSSLPHVSVISGGQLLNVTHFDGKAEVGLYMRSLGFPALTFVEPGFFMSNLQNMMRPGPDGTYTLAWPVPANTRFPLLSAADDTGKFVASALAHPVGPNLPPPPQRIMAASGWWSGQDIVDTFTRLHGPAHTGVYSELSADAWKSLLPKEVAQEIHENFLLLRDYKYYGPDVAEEGVREALAGLDGQDKPVSLEEYLSRAGLWQPTGAGVF